MDVFRFYFVMELEKIVLLPIPTGWRDSNSPMGDGLSTINGVLQSLSLICALFCVSYLKRVSVWSENAFRSLSLFLIDFFCDKPLMVDRVSPMGLLVVAQQKLRRENVRRVRSHRRRITRTMVTPGHSSLRPSFGSSSSSSPNGKRRSH